MSIKEWNLQVLVVVWLTLEWYITFDVNEESPMIKMIDSGVSQSYGEKSH